MPHVIFHHEGPIMVKTEEEEKKKNDCEKCARLQNAFARPEIFFFSTLAEYFMQSSHPIITAEALSPCSAG